MNKLEFFCITPELSKNGVSVKIHSSIPATDISYKITDSEGACVANGTASVKEQAFFAELSNAHLWSIEDPYLYTMSADITFSDGTQESFSDQFGMRSLAVEGSDILLNGKPFFIRAFIRGTVCHDHENILDLPEEEYYAKCIRIAKEYGFNTIRFHSRVPSEACFRAADKLGMFIHIEMRDCDDEYNNLEEMVHGVEVLITNEKINQFVLPLMNHPSYMVCCIGNEIKHPGENPRVREIANYIKELDPSRLFIDTCAHGEFDRDYVNFDVQHMSYYYPFGKHGDMFHNTDNLLVYGSCTGLTTTSENGGGKITRSIIPQRPIIAHEVCHYTALRNLDVLDEKFKKAGKPAPWWIAEQKKMIRAKGLEERFPDMFRASKAFQFMSWKLALEGIRRSPILRGFHMLQFADTDRYENSNGVVDCFDEQSGVDPKRFLRFNGDVVVLADIPVRSFFEGDTVVIPVSVSNYSQQEYGNCKLCYELIDTETNTVALSGELDNINIDKRGLSEIVKLHLTLPAIKKSCAYRLEVRLISPINKHVIENDWDIWSFTNKPSEMSFSDCAFNLSNINAQSRYPAVAHCPKNGKPVYVTDVLDDNVFDELEKGNRVLLFYRSPLTRHVANQDAVAGKYSFRATWERFKGVIWDRGTIYGGLVNNNDALTGFPHNGITNLQFYNLIEDSDKIILDDFPTKVTPAFQCIDKSTRDRFDVYAVGGFGLPEFQYDRTLRNFGYITEMKVGNGSLLVTGLNFTGLGTQVPEVCGMFEALINYICSDKFAPEASLSVNELKEYMSKDSTRRPVRERMMTQFWQLDDTPVESLQYWIDSKEYAKVGDEEEGR